MLVLLWGMASAVSAQNQEKSQTQRQELFQLFIFLKSASCLTIRRSLQSSFTTWTVFLPSMKMNMDMIWLFSLHSRNIFNMCRPKVWCLFLIIKVFTTIPQYPFVLRLTHFREFDTSDRPSNLNSSMRVSYAIHLF